MIFCGSSKIPTGGLGACFYQVKKLIVSLLGFFLRFRIFLFLIELAALASVSMHLSETGGGL